MKRLFMGLMLVVLLLALVACGAPPSSVPSVGPMPEGVPAPVPAPTPAPMITNDAGKGGLPVEEVQDQMIVRTGNISLVVVDVTIAMEQIAKLAESFEGYVVSSNKWGEGERLVGNITIRVVADYFDVAIGALRELAADVTSESTTSQDVTEEYIDLSAKLHNLEAAEEQLLTLMQKAETVEDILNVQRELSRVRGEIEQTTGRMQYLERTSATSLIMVNLEQAKIDVRFTADKRSMKEGKEIRFTGDISGGFAPYTYEWDFGDGDTSTSEAPIHAYKTAGTYTVSLKVTDDEGNADIETRDEYITVLPGWSAGSVASAAWNGLVTFGHVLVNVLIWLGIFTPVWGAGLGIFLWRRRRKKKEA
ncbi:DUF4349 domain-containing protein [Chloroflexota bacterium]